MKRHGHYKTLILRLLLSMSSLVFFLSETCASSKGFLEQIVARDADNFVLFEDSGRDLPQTVDDESDMQNVRLTIVKGNRAIRFIAEGRWPDTRIGKHVREVSYAGPDRIWLVTKIGRILDGAVLIKIGTGEIEREYDGLYFAPAPDSPHIAYTGREQCYLNVFLDGIRVYPGTEANITTTTRAMAYMPSVRIDRDLWADRAPQEPLPGRMLLAPFGWLDGVSVTFLAGDIDSPEFAENVSDCDAWDPSVYWEYIVNVHDLNSTTTRVGIKRKKLDEYQAKSFVEELRSAQGIAQPNDVSSRFAEKLDQVLSGSEEVPVRRLSEGLEISN